MAWGKGRSPDKPGTFRIKLLPGGKHRLSGVRSDGTRTRITLDSESEARELAGRLFPSVAKAVETIQEWSKVDDWGFPLRVDDATVSSVAQTLHLPDPINPQPVTPAPPKPAEPTKEEIEKKERRAKNARSLMDMAGIAGAAGDVFMARKLCEMVDKEPVKPDPKQVGDLRDSIKDALTEMFGDSEISPWQMAILLALGIPISMLLQSPKRKRLSEPEKKPELKSVP